MTAPRAEVAVVLASLAEPPDPALDAALGAARAADLRAAVAAHVAGVAAAAAEHVLVSTGALAEPSAVAGARAFAEPAGGALADALLAAAGGGAPLLLLAPDAPRIDAALVAAALADLDAGCAIALASGFEARACVVALATPDPRLLALVADGGHRHAIVELVESAAVAGEVGFLRHERRLVTPADAAALAADPLADPHLRALAACPDRRFFG